MRLVLLTLLLTACARPELARDSALPPKRIGAQVMVLGSYHFKNPGRDLVKADLDDHLGPKRQAEIADVASKLAAFRPTKILVESADQAKLAAAYEANASLGANETEQLGFRLARQLGLPGVVAIDSPMDMDFNRLIAAATASDDRIFLDAFQAGIQRVEAETAAQRSRTVLQNLRSLNDPMRLAVDRDLYLQMARVKHGADFAGADVLAAWYQRNFRIFANLAAAVTSPEDRVLVIYGAGHAPLLRELISASPNMVLVEPNPFLGR